MLAVQVSYDGLRILVHFFHCHHLTPKLSILKMVLCFNIKYWNCTFIKTVIKLWFIPSFIYILQTNSVYLTKSKEFLVYIAKSFDSHYLFNNCITAVLLVQLIEKSPKWYVIKKYHLQSSKITNLVGYSSFRKHRMKIPLIIGDS